MSQLPFGGNGTFDPGEYGPKPKTVHLSQLPFGGNGAFDRISGETEQDQTHVAIAFRRERGFRRVKEEIEDQYEVFLSQLPFGGNGAFDFTKYLETAIFK